MIARKERRLAAAALVASLLAIAAVACRGASDRSYYDDSPGADGGDSGSSSDAAPGDGAADATGSDGSGDGGLDADDAQEGSVTGRFTITVTVSGLIGSGLVITNGNDTVPVGMNGAYVFPTALLSGAAYDVGVLTQPTAPTQSCAVNGGKGNIGSANVTNVSVVCSTKTYTVGGNVVGLVGTGLALQNNFANTLPIGGNGPFTFTQAISSGSTFDVRVSTPPSGPSQSCSVTGGTGTVVSADVTGVVVNCGVNTFTVGGTVTGLKGTAVLQNNGGDDRTITSDGSFAFATPIASGTHYDVSVSSQPGSPSQNCTVSGGTGTMGSANVQSVVITCTTNTFTIGGSISNLLGSGLVLRDNGGDDLPVNAGATSFTFGTPVASGQAYAVTVATPPSGQACVVSNASGAVAAANVTDVALTCVPAFALQESFDGVTAPALPSGWTTQVVIGNGGDQPFKTQASNPDTAPNSVFVPEVTQVSDIVLVSPVFTPATASATLTFRHLYALEGNTPSVAYDGAVLEVKVGAGAFTDIITAGGGFVAGGYDAPVSSSYMSPIPGRRAWSGYSGGVGAPGTYVTTTVSFPAAWQGQTLQLRFRLATDKQFNVNGWRIDSVAVHN